MSKWLEALASLHPDPPITDDERRIAAIVRDMLDETEFSLSPEVHTDSPTYAKSLNADVLRVWTTIFKGA